NGRARKNPLSFLLLAVMQAVPRCRKLLRRAQRLSSRERTMATATMPAKAAISPTQRKRACMCSCWRTSSCSSSTAPERPPSSAIDASRSASRSSLLRTWGDPTMASLLRDKEEQAIRQSPARACLGQELEARTVGRTTDHGQLDLGLCAICDRRPFLLVK